MKIGVVVGTFDLFHIGHLRLLQRAKENCDILIAGVNADSVVLRDKGHMPTIHESDRCEIVKNMRYVSDVFLVTDNAPQFIRNLISNGNKVDCYFRGHEPEKQNIEKENKIIKSLGVCVVQFPYTNSISSTKLRVKITMLKNTKNQERAKN